jgi:uncharacterized membrane protein YcaP (DUF421 family)
MTHFDLDRMMLDGMPVGFLGEVALRVLLAYVVVFLFLKVSGRRGIRQLSVFELVIILTLGSAAGDVTFYEDVPLLPVAVVFACLLVLYRLTTYFTAHSHRFSSWLEGDPVTLIRDGLYEIGNLNRLNISEEEFFMELRQQGVEHLGQVRMAILEVDGDVSLFLYDPASTKAGLSVLPPEHRQVHQEMPASGIFACTRCGLTALLERRQRHTCPRCTNERWSEALTSRRPS